MTNISLSKTTGKLSLQLTLLVSSVVFFVIIALLWALLNQFPSFEGGITAKKSALADMGNTIVVFSFVALALKSSLGVFVSNFRATERNRKIRQVQCINEEIDEIKALINPSSVVVSDNNPSSVVAPDNNPSSVVAPDITSAVESPPSSSESTQPVKVVVTLTPEQLAQKEEELKNFRRLLEEAKDDVSNYRNITKNIIALLSLLAGVVISLAGIRILQSFTDVSLVGKQLSLFNAIDVLLTGGLLAGGSAGVHRLTKVYEEVTDVSKKVNQ